MLHTAQNDIDVWLVDERQVSDAALLEQYMQLLNNHEASRYERLIFARHQHQFLVSRALVRTILAEYLNFDDPACLEFCTDQNGKPELALDTSLKFNLSHTSGLIALVVMQEDQVGIDVEYLRRQVDIGKLSERYFSRDENAALNSLSVTEWNDRFFDLWTLKEAYLKACGTGLRTPLHEFGFALQPGTIDIHFFHSLMDEAANWKFWQLSVADKYRMSLAVNNNLINDFQLSFKMGIPMDKFSDYSPQLIRQSIR